MTEDQILAIILQAMDSAGRLFQGLGSGQSHYFGACVRTLANEGIETFKKLKAEEVRKQHYANIEAHERSGR